MYARTATETTCVLGQGLHYPVLVIDEDARRGRAFQRVAMAVPKLLALGRHSQLGPAIHTQRKARQRGNASTCSGGMARRLIQPYVTLDGAEQTMGMLGALGRAEQQIPVRVQTIVQGWPTPGLKVSIQINQNVPARYEVETREGRVF